MKRILGLLLSGCVLFNSFAPTAIALADDVETPTVKEKDSSVSTNETPEIYELGVFEATGNLEVDIKFVLPISNIENPNIGMNLIDQNGNIETIDFNGITFMETLNYSLGSQKGEMTIRKMDQTGNVLNGVDGEKVKYYSITIYNLKKGNYQLELYGNGYQTYHIDNVCLDDYAKRVSISNENGMFTVGDVNQDNVVNKSDIDAMIKHIDSTRAEDIKNYDLNRDGKIDIADIAIIASAMNGTSKKVEMTDTSAMIDHANMKVEGILDGKAEDLFQDNGSSVIFKPVDTTKEISKDNPVNLIIAMDKSIKMSEIRLETGSTHALDEVIAIVEDENGVETTYQASRNYLENIHFFTDKASENTIVIQLNGQIAVKKVTIKVVKTASKNLAEITEVEFLNNVYDEVPVPTIEIPKNVSVEIASESALVKYSNMQNVTGYEIQVQTMNGDQIVAYNNYQTTYTSHMISGLKNYTTYQVLVRAVNGEWKSPYSDPISFKPEPTRFPPAVESIQLTPVSSGFNISYKKMDDTLTYNIYYRKQGENEFKKIANVNGTSYQLRELVSGATYEIYITGTNHLGEGAKSQIAIGTTLEEKLPDNNKYGLLNTSNGAGKISAHIKEVTYKSNQYNASPIALVDNDYNSFWQADTWDIGGFNNNSNGSGPIFELDGVYKLSSIVVVPTSDTASFFYASITYWNNGVKKVIPSFHPTSKTSPNGQKYYVLTFGPISADKIQVNLANYSASGNIAMREVQFFQYDSLEDDVAALFADDLRIALQKDVTLDMIKALEDRANEMDKINEAYHPNRDAILRDLEYARQILQDKNIQDVMVVDQEITNSFHTGFSPLSDLQPLGIVARPGETITVYVGTNGNTMPQLVFTQYYAEASTWKQSVTNLKKGQNIIEVPKIGNMNTERGGSVYIRYPKGTLDKEIKIRVSGGTKIPYLDIHHLTSEAEIKSAITTYIRELKAYTESLPSIYQEEGLTFDKNLSVRNATEIATKNGLFSVAATAAYDGIRTGLTKEDEQVNRLYQSLMAFEEMITMFYRHKGLSIDASEKIDNVPKSRINIRLMRMFDGAFMYAGGDHIGIGYGSISGLMQGRPNQESENSITTTGFFGWGISHEIGHQINQGNLAYAEVTNNIFSLIAQTNDDKQRARIEDRYEKIYKKVTSGTIGKPSDVFVHLGMYWQLHLAYDNHLTATDTDSIFARINKLSRRTTLKGYSKDELLIVLASEAAGKDLTEFFAHWGLVITDQVTAYLKEKNLPKETRAIWYLNDDARRARLNHTAAMASDTTLRASFVSIDNQNKRYTLSFAVSQDADKILGYEIKRNGVPIMFTMEDTFTDVIGSLNNQALIYEVTAYDKELNQTNTIVLDEVKVNHDGSVDKSNFDISSNLKGEGELSSYEDETMDQEKLSVNLLIDGDNDTVFHGTTRLDSKDKTTPYVMIDFNTTMDVSGIKYKAALENGVPMADTIQKYNIYVSTDREHWILAKTGTFTLNSDNHYTNTIYFDKEGTTGGNQLWTYSDISYIKIEAVGNSGISGAEIDVIAPPGDNVEMSKDTVGILKDDYEYLDSEGNKEVIAKGSIVFKGDYRGNPAFNVVLLVDTETELPYEGENFLFASLNSEAEVYEIAEGYWFYVVSKETYETMRTKTIRAELYRVDNALTNEGQRLTSTSLSISNLLEYSELKEMEIQK